METRIQVLISKDTERGRFNDALYFTAEEYALQTEQTIQAIADERAANWVAFINEQSSLSPATPTDEELLAEKEVLLAQIAQIDAQLSQ